jgi:hypothetical protein
MAKTAKIKTAIYKNKLFVALFVLLFSGIGAYALISSHAATPNTYLAVCVTYNDSTGDCLNSAATHPASNLQFVHTKASVTGHHCFQVGYAAYDIGTTDNRGYVLFQCDADNYQIYADAPSSYVSTVSNTTVGAGTSTVARVSLVYVPPVQAYICATVNGIHFCGNGGSTYPAGTPGNVDWSSANATACDLYANGTRVLANQGTSGNFNVAPATTTGYYAICRNAYGNTFQSGTVQINISQGLPNGCGPNTQDNQCAKIAQFYADSGSTTLSNGGGTNLRWSSSNAGSCTLNGTKVATNAGLFGKATYPIGGLTGPKNYTYSLTCYGTNSSDTKSLTIPVAGPNQQLPPPCTSNCGGSGSGSGTTSGGSKKPASSGTVNDTVAPTAPTNLSAFQSGPGSVDLSWDAATDNIGVDHYIVERSTDGSTWTSIAVDVTDVSYTDVDIAFNTQYFYHVIAVDLAGNKSPASTTADITTQSFEANVTADKGATIKSDDGFVVTDIPSGAVSEDAFCEITKDSTRLTPPKLKLVAGSYQINCKNATGDDITSFDKDANITMKLKTFKGYKNFKAYTIGDTSLKLVNATFSKADQSLHFKQSDLQAFAAYGNKKGSSILFWLLLPFVLAGAVFALLRYRNSRPDNTYYDTSGYVSMPPSAPVTPNTGYEHHASLPELVAQGQQQAPPQPHDPFAAPVPPQYQQPGTYAVPPQPQVPQPQDPNQPQPPQLPQQ